MKKFSFFLLLICLPAVAQILSPIFFQSAGNADPCIVTAHIAVHFSADCITYTAGVCSTPSNGSSISVWSDRSGNGNDGTQTGGTAIFNTNKINGKPAVSASVANAHFALATATGGTSQTWFAVYKIDSPTAAYNLIFVCCSATGSLTYYGPRASGGAQQAWDNNNTATRTGTATQDFNWHQANVNLQAFPSNGYTFRLDRAADGSGTYAGINITQPSSLVAYFNNVANGGFIAEIIGYNDSLSGAEVTQNETCLNTKYGL